MNLNWSLGVFSLFLADGSKNLQLLNTLFEPSIVSNILKLHWVSTNMNDVLVWLPNCRGYYIMKSTYSLEVGYNSIVVSFPCRKELRYSRLHERHKLDLAFDC